MCEAGYEWNQCWYVVWVELVCSVSAHNLFILQKGSIVFLVIWSNIFLFPQGICSYFYFASSYCWVLDPKSNLSQKLLFRHYLLLFSLYKMDQFVFFKSTQSYMTYVLTRYHIKCNFELKWLFVFIVYLVPLPSDLSFDHGLTFFSFAFCPLSAARLMVAANYEKAEAEKILLIKWAEGEAESKYLSGLGIAR